MPRALFAGLLSSVIAYVFVVVVIVAVAASRATGHNALGDLLASAVGAVVMGWMPALGVGWLAWAVVFVRTRPAGTSTSGTAGVVALAALVVLGLVLPPGRTLLLERVFGVEGEVPVDALVDAAPGELGAALAEAPTGQRQRLAWLEATARDPQVLARYADAADRDAAAGFAVAALASAPCADRVARTVDDPVDPDALLDRTQCRVMAMETLIQAALAIEQGNRMDWLIERCGDCDLLWFRQATAERASHLPGPDTLRPDELRTLDAAAERRLATAVGATASAEPPLFTGAVVYGDDAAAAALAQAWLDARVDGPAGD